MRQRSPFGFELQMRRCFWMGQHGVIFLQLKISRYIYSIILWFHSYAHPDLFGMCEHRLARNMIFFFGVSFFPFFSFCQNSGVDPTFMFSQKYCVFFSWSPECDFACRSFCGSLLLVLSPLETSWVVFCRVFSLVFSSYLFLLFFRFLIRSQGDSLWLFEICFQTNFLSKVESNDTNSPVVSELGVSSLNRRRNTAPIVTSDLETISSVARIGIFELITPHRENLAGLEQVL